MSDNHDGAGAGACAPTATFRAFTPAGESGHVYNVGLTISAPDVGELVKRVRAMAAALDAAGWQPAYGFAGPGKAEMQAAGRADAPPVAAGPTVLATGSATGPEGPAEGAIECAYYIVSAEAGRKARVAFWNPGRKYREIDTVRKTENLPALLGNLPVEFGEHQIPTVVNWRRGNAKPAGGHYQDIVSVTPAVQS